MSPKAPAARGGRVPGPSGGKRPEAEADINSPCLSCQVITRKVNIQVGDVNDNAPTFHNQPYSVRIPEVGAPGITLKGHLASAALGPPGSRLMLGEAQLQLLLSCPLVSPGICSGRTGDQASTSEGACLLVAESRLVAASCLREGPG